MTVETRVLVGGQWTTRTMDIHQILAQNREDANAKGPSSQDEATRAPTTAGILTRTLLRSPVINWILQARIRHKYKNDVLFIGQDFVEIKRLFSDSHLEDVTVKSDFGSAIRSARVFGTPVKLPEPAGVDAIIKVTEPEEMIPPEPTSSQVPPQILVMALESQALIFLHAFDCGHDKFQYVIGQRALPAQRSYLEQLGKHMAVDPKQVSRALAVAACEKNFCLYALKTTDELQVELNSGREHYRGHFMPVREEKHFFVDGTILKMEFLHPPDGEDNHVVLLLVVSRNQRTRILYYEWDCSMRLRHAEQKGGGQLIHPEDSHPLLLIPFSISSGFMLVCEKVISVYKGILTGPATRNWLALEHYHPSQDPGSSRRLPLWTQWAKPVRHDRYASANNDVYLCREDGVVRWLEISEASEDGNVMINNHVHTGVIGCNVDTAFATLDLGTVQPDLLVCGGDASNGGLFTVSPRPIRDGTPKATQTIHNWAPIIDFVTARVSSSKYRIQRHSPASNGVLKRRERIFACSGRGSNHGAVSELRYGVEARIGTNVAIDDGVLDLWALSVDNFGTFLLLSYSAATLLLQISLNLENPNSEFVLIDNERTGLCSDDRTITAAVVCKCSIIQVTASSVHITSPGNAEFRWSRHFRKERIVAADICKDSGATLIALYHGEDIYLHFGRFSMTDELVKFEWDTPISLPSEPSCVSLQKVDEQYIASVGTLAGTLQIFRAPIDSAFTPTFEYKFDGHFAICDSIAVLHKEHNKQNEYSEIVLACGLRNGSVEILRVRPPEESADGNVVILRETIAIGSTSVRVMPVAMPEIVQESKQEQEVVPKQIVPEPMPDHMPGIYTDSCVLLLCGQDICRLSHPSYMPSYASTTVHNIWLTDQAQPSFQQGEISAIAQAGIFKETDTYDHTTPSLFCVIGTTLHVAALDTRAAPRAVTRRLPVAGTPSRIIFSERLNMLIVGSVKVEVKPARPPQQPRGKRVFRPRIDFILPDGDPVKAEPNIDGENADASPHDAFWKPGERIMGLLEWFPRGNGKSYHMLVVNTMIGQANSDTVQGRILILNFIKDENTGKLRLIEKNPSRCEKPVFSVAAYGDSSLVYGRGGELVLRTLRVSDRKWNETITHKLRSPAISISVAFPFIYVTTSRESLLVFTFEADRFVPQFSDSVARDGLRHLHLRNTGITLASDKICSVAGLWQPPERPISNSLTTLFEAVLPASITQLRQGFVRPPWRSFPHPRQEPTKPSPSILGSSTDGALYQFDILNDVEWRLLRFIQNMALRSPLVCPFTHQGPHAVHIEPSMAKGQYMHVDGDILARIVELGGLVLLREMLEVERSPEQRFVDFASPQERQTRFEQLVQEALPVGYGEDPVEVAMAYLTRAVQPVL